ncbi:MAG: hypothetical protein JWP32_2663, partial [Schumannella sp.]|nr:hypothetical protein [Schumannella sp.]
RYPSPLACEGGPGEMPERLNGAVSKTVVRCKPYPGFESLSLRLRRSTKRSTAWLSTARQANGLAGITGG